MIIQLNLDFIAYKLELTQSELILEKFILRRKHISLKHPARELIFGGDFGFCYERFR